jgi:hypothetical protein
MQVAVVVEEVKIAAQMVLVGSVAVVTQVQVKQALQILAGAVVEESIRQETVVMEVQV